MLFPIQNFIVGPNATTSGRLLHPLPAGCKREVKLFNFSVTVCQTVVCNKRFPQDSNKYIAPVCKFLVLISITGGWVRDGGSNQT